MSKIISYILKTLLDSKGFLGIVLRSIISLLLGIATYTLYNEGYSLLSVLMLVCSICFTESLLWVFYGKVICVNQQNPIHTEFQERNPGE